MTDEEKEIEEQLRKDLEKAHAEGPLDLGKSIVDALKKAIADNDGKKPDIEKVLKEALGPDVEVVEITGETGSGNDFKNFLFDSMVGKARQSALPEDLAEGLKSALGNALAERMRDPFDSKGWAKSKQFKKNAPATPTMVMELAEPTEEELDELRKAGKFGFN